MYYTEYLYKELNVLPIEKLFDKASVIYTIKNNPNHNIEHRYTTRQLSDTYYCTFYAQKTNTIYFFIHGTKNIIYPTIKHQNKSIIL